MKKSISENAMFNTISTLSQASFFIHRPIFLEHLLLEQCFKNNSYEIFQFLNKNDIENIKMTNKFFVIYVNVIYY